jgi:hypothetical protein
MGNERQYQLVTGNHYHGGERLRRGDVFVPTDKELSAFGYKFEPVESEPVESESVDETVADDPEEDADQAVRDSEDDADGPEAEPVAAPEDEDEDDDDSDVDGELAAAEIDEAFDADDFLHEHWQTVVQMIDAGGADEHLDTIEAREQDRSSPRQSVLAALNGRREDPAADGTKSAESAESGSTPDSDPDPDAAGSLRETASDSDIESWDENG